MKSGQSNKYILAAAPLYISAPLYPYSCSHSYIIKAILKSSDDSFVPETPVRRSLFPTRIKKPLLARPFPYFVYVVAIIEY
jgi:hypothetical protein